MKTFLEIYRTRHFGRAADNLHLSQLAVSARIRLLEDELGVTLFSRERNNIQLTAAGQKLLRHAGNIVTTEKTLSYFSAIQTGSRWTD